MVELGRLVLVGGGIPTLAGGRFGPVPVWERGACRCWRARGAEFVLKVEQKRSMPWPDRLAGVSAGFRLFAVAVDLDEPFIAIVALWEWLLERLCGRSLWAEPVRFLEPCDPVSEGLPFCRRPFIHKFAIAN